ncbi:hypothetical protein V1478_013006 [Vespula squamosa]|uniref:Uncharacterized protein n=1 Tax=Vespula squamosa TaxID=30214 RepID=A0ABD2AA72_VESSQ
MKNQCDPPPSPTPPPPPSSPPAPTPASASAPTSPNQRSLKRKFTNEVGDLMEEEEGIREALGVKPPDTSIAIEALWIARIGDFSSKFEAQIRNADYVALLAALRRVEAVNLCKETACLISTYGACSTVLDFRPDVTTSPRGKRITVLTLEIVSAEMYMKLCR